MHVKEIIEKRRAFRSLEKIEITDEIVKKLANSAQLAPSCFNKQPWRYAFIYEKNKLDELKKALSPGNEWAHDSSMIIAVFSKKDYDCVIKEREYFLFDTGLATGLMILRATELGLVAHPIAGYDEKMVKEFLKIPEEYRVITLVIVGKKSEIIKPSLSKMQIEIEKSRPERIPLENFVNINDFYEKEK